MNENDPEIETIKTPSEEPEETPQAVTPPSRARRVFQQILRWTFGILIIFGLGFLLAVFTLYLPTRQALNNKENSLRQSSQAVQDIQAKLADAKDIANELQVTQNDLNNATLHNAILGARIDVTGAQLAMAEKQPEKAHLVLGKTGETLKSLEKLVDKSQQKIVSDLESRLILATGEIDTNPYAAQSDLDVLATGLLELENAYFSTP
jgi:predicted RNA-binding protein Jag